MSPKRISLLPSECCGCGLCARVCPTGAITMGKDAWGFPFPSLDADKCVDCGLCRSKCPFLNAGKWTSDAPQTAYAAVLKDPAVLARSASGGVFAGLASAVLRQGGVVFGAAWNPDFSVAHIPVSSLDDLSKLQQSKYTQSSVESCFVPLKDALASGKMVLFSGTPCQVAAVKSFLGNDPPNLLTLDLVCHGVGSPAMLADDIAFLSSKFRTPVAAVSFRSKRRGWGTSGNLVLADGPTKEFSPLVSPFYHYYLSGCLFRESCYSCPFASGARPGDFTAGDFWGIHGIHPDAHIPVRKGVSSLLVNTPKGRSFFESCRSAFHLHPSTPEKIASRNLQLRAPSSKPPKHATLFALAQGGGYSAIVRYWRRDARRDRLKLRFKRLLPSFVKITLQRFL